MINYIELREKLLKYKREYEEEMNRCIPMYPKDELIVKGHLRMLDILLDDIDSMVNYVDYENISRGEVNNNSFILGVDLAKENN